MNNTMNVTFDSAMNVTSNYTMTQWHDMPRQGRSLTGILVKTIFTSAATTLVAQHLASLRRQPFHVASYQVLASLLIPTYAIADILIPAYRTMKAVKRTGWENSTRYYICAALDMRASSVTGLDGVLDTEKVNKIAAKLADGAISDVCVPLHLVPYQKLELQRQRYDFKWCLRLVALAMFASQAILVEVSWVRRAQHGARTFLDDFVALAALQGLMIALQSMGIMLLNTTWQVPNEYVRKFEKHCNEPSSSDLFLNLAWRTDLIDLRLSLVVAVILQSMAFLWTTSGYSTGIFLGASCFPKMRHEGGRRVLIPTSSGLEWSTIAPRPCHPWNEEGLKNAVSILAESGYIICFCSAFAPLLLLVGFLINYLSPRGMRQHRIGRGLLRGYAMVVQSCGGLYLLLGYGLSCITIWDLTSPRAWEPWMWKDPLSDQIWTL